MTIDLKILRGLKYICLLVYAYLFVNAAWAVYEVADGTGAFIGAFALSWLIILAMFIILGCGLGLGLYFFLFGGMPQRVEEALGYIRAKTWLRYLLIIFILFIPPYLLGQTDLGIIFPQMDFRVWVWFAMLILTIGLVNSNSNDRYGIAHFLIALLLTGASIKFISSLIMSDYPFSLTWSEGNRFWDYSLAFGKRLYNFSEGTENIRSLTSYGRLVLWGLPFLFSDITIKEMRIWDFIVFNIPPLIFGWALFKRVEKNKVLWFLAGVWAYLFIQQGPIYSPLTLCAILVVLSWRRSNVLLFAGVLIATYYASISRYTWIFAPAIWMVMLEFNDHWKNARLDKMGFIRLGLVGIALLLGGFFVPWIFRHIVPDTYIIEDFGRVSKMLNQQPLLWYRLFPSSTYPIGILLGLFIAIIPLISLCVYAIKMSKTKFDIIKTASIVLPLIAFLSVGLTASVKIGGGSNLHNLDMFLLGLLFSTAIFWNAIQILLSQNYPSKNYFVFAILLVMIFLPVRDDVSRLRPVEIQTTDTAWLSRLLEIPKKEQASFFKDNENFIPPRSEWEKALSFLNEQIKIEQTKGDVLFIDQRQLLTFRYVPDVKFKPEYEKKRLMEMAIRGDADFFRGFYTDLKNKKYTLIITEILNTGKYDEYLPLNFIEEGSAWVHWVSEPLLCFYHPHFYLLKHDVQMLVPRENISACAKYLP